MNTVCNIVLGQQAAGGGIGSLLMIVAMIVIFYFFMIRPQSKKQKELKKQRDAIAKGDRVVTAGGIHGRVKEVSDTYLIVEVAQGVSIKVDKGSIYPVGEELPKADK